MGNNNYDVVIVGSGIAGAIVAKLLTNAGKKVLLLEAGLKAGISLDPEESYKTYQGYLNTYYTAFAKGAPNSPYPNLKNAPSVDALDLVPLKPGVPSTKGYLVQMGPIPFGSDCTRAPGGTTLHWLGTTLRMLPNDFKMQTKYKVGVDWPFSYETLMPYYEMAENEIGVSGDVFVQKPRMVKEDMFGKGYVYPMKAIPTSYLDKEVTALIDKNSGVVLNKKKYTLYCLSTPQGRNSVPNPDYKITGTVWNPASKKLELTRTTKKDTYQPVGAVWDPHTGQRCEGNASCVPICPVQAKYNALKTLKKCDMGNLTISTQSVASRVLINETSGQVSGIEYKVYKTDGSNDYETFVAKGAVYVLAASAIENAKLLLASGAANSSDQVGRNLMDHMTVLRWGLTKNPVYPFRGPGSTTNIATFRDGDFRKEHSAWITPLDNWGWAWPTFSPGTDVAGFVAEGLFGNKLRNKVKQLITRQFLVHFECEQIPDPENRVTIMPEYKDKLGNYRPVIHYRANEYMLKAFEAATTVSNQLFKQCDIEDRTQFKPQDTVSYVKYKGVGYRIDGAGHIVGTHRMGNDSKTSVVDPEMRTWDHKNLFLVGCGNMPTIGTSNPTLTMSALTFKAAEAILKQLSNY